MMALTGHETIEDLRYQFARRLYTAVVLNSSTLKLKDVMKIPDVENIVINLKRRSQWNGVRAFLQMYPCFFLVTEESGSTVIKPIVTIEFCRDFDGKRGCSRAYCSKLHVCRHFVKGKCTFGPRCKKPHHFQKTETREVLKKHFLDVLNDEQAREFLCRNVQHLLDPESANIELPKCLEICKYYNVATGCTREFCPYIHVCRFFAEEGNCKFGSQCIRKHDINNVHSRILLHRYHMEHLNDQQVIAYLKIKSENREQQPQQLNTKDKQPQTPSLMPSFSLPNGIVGSVHAAIVNDIGRKLSQPSQMNGLSLVDDVINTRKLSLPNPPITRPLMYRPPVTHEENLHSTNITKPVVGSNIQGNENIISSNKFGSSIDERFLSVTNENDFEHVAPKIMNSHPSRKSFSSGSSIMDIFNSNFNQKLTLSRDNPDKLSNTNTYEGLGLNNLSPPTTMDDYVMSKNNIIVSKNISLKSRSFDNFRSKDIDNQNNVCSDMSKSFQPSCLSYSSSTKEHSSSFFTSRIPFMRASSNDIISPTDSTSSINGTSYVNSTSSSYNCVSNTKNYGQNNQEWREHETIWKSFSGKDGSFVLPYHRTQSLPNFITHGCDDMKHLVPDERDCTCHKTELCIFHLRGICRFPSCKKLHTDETFQWQISTVPSTKHNGFKNENFDLTPQRWMSVDKNENLKLESAFCSPEIEEVEIDYYGENIMVNFNDMIGTARGELHSANQITSQRSCDLSAWLLQTNEETPRRRNSQDTVVYNIRRLSTRSCSVEDFDISYATQWIWYWLDSFGIWRKYPSNKTEVIEASTTCYLDELESRFLEGYNHYVFEELKLFVDFKSMVQVNCMTRKQKKIRRRPRFTCKEQRDRFRSFNDSSIHSSDVRKPWYWSKEIPLTNKPYELVDVSPQSDTYVNVQNHLGRSLDEKCFIEILSMKSVQNLRLWTQFINLRSEFEKSNIQYADKFVFKSIAQENLAGVCQQGFPICSCKQKKGLVDEENVFTTEASYALNHLTTECKNDDIRYLFCVRITVPVSDLNEDENRLSSSPEDGELISIGSLSPTQSIMVRHDHQVYPEFLVVFKV